MSHIPYTICRSGTYYYNRRVPKHAVNSYGQFISAALQQIGLRGSNVSLPSNAAMLQVGSEKSISYISNLPLNTALQQRYLPI